MAFHDCTTNMSQMTNITTTTTNNNNKKKKKKKNNNCNNNSYNRNPYQNMKMLHYADHLLISDHVCP